MNSPLIKIKYGFLLLLLFPLAGCPIPAYYQMFNSTYPNDTTAIRTSNWQVNRFNGGPWLDHHKKCVIIGATVTNAGTDTIAFPLSQALLQTNNDSFYLNYSNKKLNNDFVMREDTILVAPGGRKEIVLYFLSNNNYTRKQYNRSIERDTLYLQLPGSQNKIVLKGVRNY
jgi:hypothetical protein